MTWVTFFAFGLGLVAGWLVKHISVEADKTDQRIKDLVWWDHNE